MLAEPFLVFLYCLICLIWGSTWLAIKIGLVGVPPMLAAGLRFTLAAAVLFCAALARGSSFKLSRDDKLCVLSCGFFSFTLSYACVYWAESLISSGLTAILFSTMPLFVALLSALWTKTERLSPRTLGGIAVGMAGTAVLFWPQDGLSRAQALGMALALLSSLAAAINLVMVKRHGRSTDIFAMNALGMAMGAACLLALSLATESYAALAWSWSNAAALVYLALFGTVTAFLSYYHLVKRMDATPLSLITLIFPIIAVALGRLFLDEPISRRALAGIGVILSGVAVTSANFSAIYSYYRWPSKIHTKAAKEITR